MVELHGLDGHLGHGQPTQTTPVSQAVLELIEAVGGLLRAWLRWYGFPLPPRPGPWPPAGAIWGAARSDDCGISVPKGRG
jgi:hypothetical protein